MKYIIGVILIILLLLEMSACAQMQTLADTDDMYKQTSDTIIVKRIRRSPKPNRVYYTSDYGWYGWAYSNGYPYQYYRPNVIIVTPKSEPEFKYGKRPDREGNGGVGVPIGRRRGRD